MPEITSEKFLQDSQGRTFRDVVDTYGEDFNLLLGFFSDEARQIRMEDAERHHDRPALAGVVRELENDTRFSLIRGQWNSSNARRLRQAIGVIVRIIMEERGWRKAGRRGALGQKLKKDQREGTVMNHNTSGLSWWFCRVERFEKTGEEPFTKVGSRLPERMGGLTDSEMERWGKRK